MNLSDLKTKPVPELLEIAKGMGLDNVNRSRKQDLIFTILKRHAKSGEDIWGDGVLEIYRTVLAFCVLRQLLTWQGPMTSTSRPARFDASTCAPAILSRARSGHPRKANVILPCSKLTKSTTSPWKVRATRFCSRISRRYFPKSA